MASIRDGRRNKDGSYSFQFRVFKGTDSNGKKVYANHTYKGQPTWSEERTRKKALAYATILEDNYRSGYEPNTKLKFNEFATMVINDKESMGVIKHSTANRYRDSLSKVDPYIGNIRLTSIRVDHLNSMYREMQEIPGVKTHRLPSAKTILEHHRFVSMVLEEAFKQSILIVNVAKRATPPKVKHKDVNFYDDETARAILAAADQEPLKWQTIVYLLLFSGVRKGELLGLKWPLVDFQESTISIRSNILYEPDIGIYEDSPKTEKSIRTISLPGKVMHLLKSLHHYQMQERLRVGAYGNPDGFVFAKEDGSPMHPDSIGTYLKRFGEKYGLPKLNAHAFRHTMASMLFMEGVDSVSISSRLGHAQVSTTANIYAHSLPKKDKKNSEKLEELFLKKA